jgi:hypothetical protein
MPFRILLSVYPSSTFYLSNFLPSTHLSNFLPSTQLSNFLSSAPIIHENPAGGVKMSGWIHFEMVSLVGMYRIMMFSTVVVTKSLPFRGILGPWEFEVMAMAMKRIPADYANMICLPRSRSRSLLMIFETSNSITMDLSWHPKFKHKLPSNIITSSQPPSSLTIVTKSTA